MVAQGVLPFQYEVETGSSGMTALAGLPLYLELFAALGLSKSIRRHLGVRPEQGWSDAEVVTALLLLNLAGGDCVEDLALLGQDEGFCQVLRRAARHGLGARGRAALKRRWRREQRGVLPSASAVFRYLAAFHDEEEEQRREQGKAFIPAPNGHLLGLGRVNGAVLGFVQSRAPKRTATLDIDATLVETHKSEALYCYQKFKAYQPQNVYWAEQGLVVHSQFRDGNVPAGSGQLPVLKAALAALPEGVKQVLLREDSAGYDWELLTYCAEGKNERFGVIEFAVSADVTDAFKKAVAQVPEADWQPLRRRGEEQADPACARMDEHRLPLPDGVRGRAEVVGGHPLEERRRGHLVGDAVGHRHRLRDVDEHLLGVASLRRRPTDPLAGRNPRDPLADRGDRAGALDARDDGKRLARHPDPLVDVPVVHPGRAHLDEELPRAGDGRRALLELEHLRPAVSVDHDRSHTSLPVRSPLAGTIPSRRARPRPRRALAAELRTPAGRARRDGPAPPGAQEPPGRAGRRIQAQSRGATSTCGRGR